MMRPRGKIVLLSFIVPIGQVYVRREYRLVRAYVRS